MHQFSLLPAYLMMMPAVVACAGIFSYAALAYLLTKHPQLIYGRKKLRFIAPHISHRGGAAERPENTIAAFQHAVNKCRTNMLELDCHLTKDGKVVVVHDEELFRLTGVNGKVCEYNYSELPLLRNRLRVSFSPADVVDSQSFETHSEVGLANFRRICLLEDVFAQFPKTAINLDVKVNDDELIEGVAALIRKYKRESITVWGNRDSTICDKCYRLAPEIPLIFSARRVIITVLLFYIGLLPFYRLNETFFEIPAVSMMLNYFEKQQNAPRSSENSTEDDEEQSAPIQFNWKIRLLMRMINGLIMRPTLFEHLHKRGIATFVWVLNDESAFDRAFRHYRVDGVMTDKPTALRRYMSDNPKLFSQSDKSN